MCLNDSMTFKFKTNYVLINDLQSIYKHKHIFNNTQCKIHNRHIITLVKLLLNNWALLNKQMAQ